MAASQRDMFRGSQSDTEMSKKVEKRISSSLGPKTHQYMYDWCVLFNWDCNEKCPFFFYKLSQFTDEDLKPEWISGKLGIKSRIHRLTNLSPFPGGVYSLFSKIELGTTAKERKDYVSKLNEKYAVHAAIANSEVSECLRLIASDTPYR